MNVRLRSASVLGISLCVVLSLGAARAVAQTVRGVREVSAYQLQPPASPPPHVNELGGHLGLGVLPTAVGTGGTQLIGRDIGIMGIVAGLNLGINEHWSIDFEFIVNMNFKDTSRDVSNTTFVLDPGVKYAFGRSWVGLRLAARVPSPLGAELGFIPIIGTKWPICQSVHYYVELDLPVFIASPSGAQFVTYLQTGLAF